MKGILCSLLVATLPFGSVLADAPKSKNAKVTLVYQHGLPNVPGKSIKGVLAEYGPGGVLKRSLDYRANAAAFSISVRTRT
jgi:CRISPR/Cas system CMR subunit Cmr6 (Cas7 group RAMP superfamily)